MKNVLSPDWRRAGASVAAAAFLQERSGGSRRMLAVPDPEK